MKVIKYIFEKMLLPFLLSVPVITIILSIVKTGQWSNYFKVIFTREWIIILVLVLFALIIVQQIILKIKSARKRNSSGISLAVVRTPQYGWKEIGTINYKNVLWKVKLAINSSMRTSHNVTLDDVAVDTLPRCPKCGTELEQQRALIRGYVWKCIDCSFKIRNKDSFYTEAKRAEKIAKRKAEKEFGK